MITLDSLKAELAALHRALAAAGINPANAVTGLEELVEARRSAGKSLLTLRADNGRMQERIKLQDNVTQVLVDQLLDVQQRQELVIDLLWDFVAEIASANGGPLTQEQVGKLHSKLEILK